MVQILFFIHQCLVTSLSFKSIALFDTFFNTAYLKICLRLLVLVQKLRQNNLLQLKEGFILLVLAEVKDWSIVAKVSVARLSYFKKRKNRYAFSSNWKFRH